MKSHHHASLPDGGSEQGEAAGSTYDKKPTNVVGSGANTPEPVASPIPLTAAITVDACHECGRGFTRNLLWPIYAPLSPAGRVLWCEACIDRARDEGLA